MNPADVNASLRSTQSRNPWPSPRIETEQDTTNINRQAESAAHEDASEANTTDPAEIYGQLLMDIQGDMAADETETIETEEETPDQRRGGSDGTNAPYTFGALDSHEDQQQSSTLSGRLSRARQNRGDLDRAMGGESQQSKSQRSVYGRHRDLFAYYVDQGEAFMREGQYYRASQNFLSAATYTHAPAVIYLANAYAMFGAGEFINAAAFLRNTYNHNSAMAIETVDMDRLFPDSMTFSKRFVELKRWRKNNPSVDLLLLEGYLEYQSGFYDKAAAALNQANAMFAKTWPNLKEDPLIVDLIERLAEIQAAGPGRQPMNSGDTAPAPVRYDDIPRHIKDQVQ